MVAFWSTYRIGSLLFSRRVGIWAAILVGLSFDYAFCSVEFQTDNLWAPLWLLCITVLLGGALTMRRALIAGFLMGLCFGVSLKTLLLLMSTLIGGSMTLIFVGRERLGIGWKQILGASAAFFASALIVPATIMAAFALYGIWPQFRYWVFEHNVVPGLSNHPAWWVIIFVVGFPLVALRARRMVAATPKTVVAARRSFVFVTAGFFFTALVSFWPFLSRQDYLPFYPLAFVIGTGAVLTAWTTGAGIEISRRSGASSPCPPCSVHVNYWAPCSLLRGKTKPRWKAISCGLRSNLLSRVTSFLIAEEKWFSGSVAFIPLLRRLPRNVFGVD